MWTEEQIHAYLKENLKEDRYNHVISVKETAIKLAEKYNIDVYKAKIAALCHDCAKNMSDNELLNMIKEHNINLDWISLKKFTNNSWISGNNNNERKNGYRGYRYIKCSRISYYRKK